MNRYYHIIIFAILGAIFLSILMGEVNFFYIAIGALTAGLGAYVININMLFKPSIKRASEYLIHSVKVTLNIFTSSFTAIRGFMKNNKISIKVINSNDNISSVVLANSLTLTPGTVVIDKTGDELSVLHFVEDEDKDD